MRVVTWNLWWRFGPWQERQPAIARSLVELKPDIVCLQEVWSTSADDEGLLGDERPAAIDQAEVLANALGGFHVARTEERFRDGVSFGNAILSRWPIVKSASLDLPPIKDGRSHRKALFTAVEAPHGIVPVFCTHLAYRFDESELRQRQVRLLLEFIDEHRDKSQNAHPPVLGGDLNAVPTSDEIRLLTGESATPVEGLVMTDAWPQRGTGDGVTWTHRNPYSADASWPQRRIDYLMVGWPRPKPLGNVLSCEVACVESIDGVQPSDHYAVVADLHEGFVRAQG
ncbi:MAG: endonuclease/exonuclease/phosphatase family protein [Acidimicrobiales bacterium]|jgi:endonuclease/exonuclease/phosphatase family metal-dependent hydrolase